VAPVALSRVLKVSVDSTGIPFDGHLLFNGDQLPSLLDWKRVVRDHAVCGGELERNRDDNWRIVVPTANGQ